MLNPITNSQDIIQIQMLSIIDLLLRKLKEKSEKIKKMEQLVQKSSNVPVVKSLTLSLPVNKESALGNYTQGDLNNFKIFFNDMNTKYNYWFGEHVKIGDNIYKKAFQNQKIENRYIKDKSYNFHPFFVNYNNVMNDSFDKRVGEQIGLINDFVKNPKKGGAYINVISGMQFDYLTPRIDPKNYLISFSAFDGDFGSNKKGGATYTNPLLGRKKDIVIYLETLITALKVILTKLKTDKLWDKQIGIRIYIDGSISSEQAKINQSVDKTTVIAKFFNSVNEYNYEYKASHKTNLIEIVDVRMPLFSPNGINHVGLIGVMFRFHPFLDPDVVNCFIGDIDNYPTNILFKMLDDFFKSETNIMVFRPHIYSRKNVKGDCIPNFFAGMFAFKKERNKVLNPILWQNTFVYMNELYQKYQAKQIVGDCTPLKDVQKGEKPFEFGFEEQAISNVIMANYLLSGYKLTVIPIYWLHPPAITEFVLTFYKTKFALISPAFRGYFQYILNIDVDIFDESLIPFHSYDNNLHILAIFENFIFDNLINDNNLIKMRYYPIQSSSQEKQFIDTRPMNLTRKSEPGLSEQPHIQIFNNSSDMNIYKRNSGNFLLYVIYPGYELSVDQLFVDKMVKNLKEGRQIDYHDYLFFEKSHTFNQSIVNLIRAYCV